MRQHPRAERAARPAAEPSVDPLSTTMISICPARGCSRECSAGTSSQPRGVVPDRDDERDARLHSLGSPSVQSGFMPDGSTLNSLYIRGMLVNISTTNTTVQTTR